MIVLAILIGLWLLTNLLCAAWCWYCADKHSIIKKESAEPVKQTTQVCEQTDKSASAIGVKQHILSAVTGLELIIGKYIGKIPSHVVRKVLYRSVLAMKLAKHVVIHNSCEFRNAYNMQIGEGSIIGDQCILDARNGIYIGRNVNLSTGVWIWTEQHDVNDRHFRCTDKKDKKVVIEDRAWISCRTVILPGVKIAEGCVIAAGAVVTKDTEPYSVYAGVPAKKIGKRNEDLMYEFKGEHCWFY